MISQEVCILFTYYHLVNGKHWLNLQCFQKQLRTKNFIQLKFQNISKNILTWSSSQRVITKKVLFPCIIFLVHLEKCIILAQEGGAVRPSSGYAFTFIQKQAFQIISQIKNRKKINTQIHNAIDLFLDKIFINVINEYPLLASKIFSSLARILNGDEMAKFMSGNASLLTTCKIIISMPKIPFIKSFFYVVYRKWFNLP